MAKFQQVTDRPLNRSDHVWRQTRVPVRGASDADESPALRTVYKCCLCGAITESPPPYPTPPLWLPTEYQLPLTAEERGAARTRY